MNKTSTILIVGAGFSGAVVATRLAEKGFTVDVVDSRNHSAGNCHTERDVETNILVHKYGPHIFHTNDKIIWDFISQYSEFMPYIHHVKSVVAGNVYSLPINLHTINQFYNKSLNPHDARKFIDSVGDKLIKTPGSFEKQALKFIGKDLYAAFFAGYTKKQWGVNPSQLPASILKRLPVRFNYDDRYFSHNYQGIPKDGYTAIVNKMLDHPNITVTFNTKVLRHEARQYEHVFCSGAIDEWFDYTEGCLDYRTLDFEEIRAEGDYQGCSVMNYGDENIPYTRITEHKFFEPWNTYEKTIAFKEFSRTFESGDIQYYPVRLLKQKEQLKKYVALAQSESNISFIGRLGTYRYLDMDVTVAEALHAADEFEICKKNNAIVPAFFSNMIT